MTVVTVRVCPVAPAGVVGDPYDVELTAADGKPPYIWSSDPRLPAGLELESTPQGERSRIHGTPTEPTGSRPVTYKITVIDTASAIGHANLVISPKPAVSTRFDSYLVLSLGVLVIAIIQWVKFLLSSKPALENPVDLGLITFSVATAIVSLIVMLMKRAGGLSVAIMFVNAVLVVIGAFAQLYWDSGNTVNFSTRLSHLDAVYFALGTLTTGSGNIVAQSEYSRTIQTIQLVFDLVLMGFAAGVVFGIFADYIKRPSRR
jgi:ion channel